VSGKVWIGLKQKIIDTALSERRKRLRARVTVQTILL